MAMAGALPKYEPEAQRMLDAARRANRAPEAPAVGAFAQLLAAADMGVTAKGPGTIAGNQAVVADVRERPEVEDAEEAVSDEASESESPASTEETSPEDLSLSEEVDVELAAGEEVEVEATPELADGEQLEAAPEEVPAEVQTVTPDQIAQQTVVAAATQAPRPDVQADQKSTGPKDGSPEAIGDVLSDQTEQQSLPQQEPEIAVEADAADQPAPEVESDVQSRTVGESVSEGAELELPAPEAPQTSDKNLIEADPAAIDPLTGADDAVSAEAPEMIAAPRLSPEAVTVASRAGVTPGAIAAAASAQSQTGGGESGSQQSGNQAAAATEALRNARAQAAQAKAPQFSKAMQERSIEVARQVAQAISVRGAMRADGAISLLLKPQTLGAIRLEMQILPGGQLEIDAIVEQAATRRLMVASIEELRVALKESNIELGRLNVQESGQADSRGSGGADARATADGGGQSQGRAGNRAQANAGAAVSQPAEANEESNSVEFGNVNVRA